MGRALPPIQAAHAKRSVRRLFGYVTLSECASLLTAFLYVRAFPANYPVPGDYTLHDYKFVIAKPSPNSACTTKLYDRGDRKAPRDFFERIRF